MTKSIQELSFTRDKFISRYAGTCVHGSLRSEDIIPPMLETLRSIIADSGKPMPLASAFWGRIANDSQQPGYYESDAPMEDIETLMDILGGIGSEFGYYFGAHEGDGSDFGFWKDELGIS